MPWSVAPADVKKRYSERCAAVWLRVANDEIREHGDDGRAIRIANTAARNCMESTSAKAMVPVKAQAMDSEEMEAWFGGETPRRILAIPFGGPIPAANAPRGVDLDGEWFSERTDIYGPYKELRETRERPVDFHHSYAPPSAAHGDPFGKMKGVLIGKSVLDEEPDEDGWWADIWFRLGESRVKLVKQLAARGAQLFGSSQPVGKIVRGKAGEILVWPHLLQTISPSPQNTYSVIKPAKAILDDLDSAQIDLPSPLKAWLADLDALGANLPQTFPEGGDAAATATRLTERIPELLEAWGIRKQ